MVKPDTKKMPSTVFLQTSFAITGALLILIAYLFTWWLPENTLLGPLFFGLSFLVGGYFKAAEGLKKTIETRVLNVEMLMIFAAVGAFVTQNFSEGAILILIFSVSGALESYTLQKSEKELKALLTLAPDQATLMNDGVESTVSVSSLKPGDVVMVRVGEKIPVDGRIIKGHTSINESTITGESMPVEKKEGQTVFAATLNESSVIYVETEKDPSESTVQKIIDFVKSAQEDAPKSQNTIQNIERIYVYVVILMALSFMLIPASFNWLTWEEAFYRGIIVLVVGSPCALVASISPAILASLSKASRHKVLIKGGSKLEKLTQIKVVLFDKTGTLTVGQPTVQTIYFEDPLQENTLAPIIKTMESTSTHPLAKAIVQTLSDVPTVDLSAQEIPGQGLRATYQNQSIQVGRFEGTESNIVKETIDASMARGESIVRIYLDQKVVGFYGCADPLRPGAKALIQTLQEKGLKTVLVTGDNEMTAQVIGQSIGIDAIHSGCFPEDKVKIVKKYQAEEGPVLMLGDGINDAPALSLADVSVAMGSGTDVSLETSDIVLINNQLHTLEDTLKLAKKTRRIIIQNVTLSIAVIVFLMTINVFGWILLPLAVVFHEGSTILVILNSLRLII